MEIKGLRNYTIMIKKIFKIRAKWDSIKQQSSLRMDNLQLPKWKNCFGKMTSEYRGHKIFNKLPKQIRGVERFCTLKLELKKLWGG
jgi:hypothetical protein